MNLDILIRIEQKQKQSPGIYGTVDRRQKIKLIQINIGNKDKNFIQLVDLDQYVVHDNIKDFCLFLK